MTIVLLFTLSSRTIVRELILHAIPAMQGRVIAVIRHEDISDADLRSLIKQGKIHFGGNCKLKIYGLLQCKSGKRIKRENRVFFSSVAVAIENNYRPCGNCMRGEYKKLV